MGNRSHPGAKQQHDPMDLRDAARQLRRLAKEMERDCVGSFRKGMGDFALSTLYAVSDAQRTSHDDKTIAKGKGVGTGANSDWLNPFGHFGEANRLMERMDDARQAGDKDGVRGVGQIERMAAALDRAADYYESAEGQNTDLTKKMMINLITGKYVPSSRA